MDQRVREFYKEKESRITNLKNQSRNNSEENSSLKKNYPKINKKSKEITRTYEHMMKWHNEKLDKWVMKKEKQLAHVMAPDLVINNVSYLSK